MEVVADLSTIRDEDLLRKMWTQAEDFGRKKEIRSHLYKLREERLRDFYTTGEMDGATDFGLTKSPLTPSHGDSLADQSFQSFKTKEIRDSESPTRELKYRGGGVIVPDTSGWNIQTSSEVSKDGRAHKAETLATTEGIQKVKGGHAEFAGRNLEKSSASHYGDDKNYVKQASESSNTHLHEKVVTGDENSGRTETRMSSVVSSSSQQVISKQTMEGDDDFSNAANSKLSNAIHQQQKQIREDRQESTSKLSNSIRQQQQEIHESRQESRKEVREQSFHESVQKQESREEIRRQEQKLQSAQSTRTETNPEVKQLLETIKRQSYDKSTPEYQKYVDYLASQQGRVLSETCENVKPNVKLITTKKELADGTIVTSRRYETLEDRAHKQTRESEDVFTRLSKTRDTRSRDVTDHATVRQDDQFEVLDTHKTVKKDLSRNQKTTSRDFIDTESGRRSSTTSVRSEKDVREENVKITHEEDFRGTHGFPSIRPEGKPRDSPRKKPEDFIGTHGFPSVKDTTITSQTEKEYNYSSTEERKTSQDFTTHGGPRDSTPTKQHPTPSRQQDSPPKPRQKPEDFIGTHGFPSVREDQNVTVSRQTESTYSKTSEEKRTSEDFTTHGFPSTRPSAPRDTTPSRTQPGDCDSPRRTQRLDDFKGTHGFPSVKVDSDVTITSKTDKEYKYSEERRTSEDFTTHGFPSARPTGPRDSTPSRVPHDSPKGAQRPTDFKGTHGFPSVKVDTTKQSDNHSSTERRTSEEVTTRRSSDIDDRYNTPRRPSKPADEDFRGTHGFPSVKEDDTRSVTTESSDFRGSTDSLRREKKVDAAHNAFASSLRCVSPVDSSRPSSQRSTRPSVGSIRSSHSPCKRDGRSPSIESNSSRLTSATVTKARGATTDKRTSTTSTTSRTTKDKKSEVYASNETIDLSTVQVDDNILKRRGTKEVSSKSVLDTKYSGPTHLPSNRQSSPKQPRDDDYTVGRSPYSSPERSAGTSPDRTTTTKTRPSPSKTNAQTTKSSAPGTGPKTKPITSSSTRSVPNGDRPKSTNTSTTTTKFTKTVEVEQTNTKRRPISDDEGYEPDQLKPTQKTREVPSDDDEGFEPESPRRDSPERDVNGLKKVPTTDLDVEDILIEIHETVDTVEKESKPEPFYLKEDSPKKPADIKKPKTKPTLSRSETFEERCRQILGMENTTTVENTSDVTDFINVERSFVDEQISKSVDQEVISTSTKSKPRTPEDATKSPKGPQRSTSPQKTTSRVPHASPEISKAPKSPQKPSPTDQEFISSERAAMSTTGPRATKNSKPAKSPERVGPRKPSTADQEFINVERTTIRKDTTPAKSPKTPKESMPLVQETVVIETSTVKKTRKDLDVTSVRSISPTSPRRSKAPTRETSPTVRRRPTAETDEEEIESVTSTTRRKGAHSSSVSPYSSPSRKSSPAMSPVRQPTYRKESPGQSPVRKQPTAPPLSPDRSPVRKQPGSPDRSPTRSPTRLDKKTTLSSSLKAKTTEETIKFTTERPSHITVATIEISPPSTPHEVQQSPQIKVALTKPEPVKHMSVTRPATITTKETTTRTTKVVGPKSPSKPTSDKIPYSRVPSSRQTTSTTHISRKSSDVASDIETSKTLKSTPVKKSPAKKAPVIERKESAPVYRTTAKVDKDAQKMSRSTSDNLIRTTTTKHTKAEPVEEIPRSPRKNSAEKAERRPSKHLTTKTINLATVDTVINSEDMETVVIDIQQAKSSREPSPNKIVPTPVPLELDTGKPRFPDAVTEPDDEPKRKPVVKNIPIFEEETDDFVSCHITEVGEDVVTEDITKVKTRKFIQEESNTEVDDECFLSVHEKVNKFISTAEEVKKPKASSPFQRDVPTDEIPEDECLLTVDEKVSKFLASAEKVTKDVTTSKTIERPKLEDLDEDIKADECVLSVSEKVNKFTDKAEKLAPTAPQRSPELVAKIERQISRHSDDTELVAKTTLKSTVTDKLTAEKPLEDDYPSTVQKETRTVSKVKSIFENGDEKPKQRDILSRPSIWEKKRQTDVKLEDIGVYKTEDVEDTEEVEQERITRKPTKIMSVTTDSTVSSKKDLFENRISVQKTEKVETKTKRSGAKSPERPSRQPTTDSSTTRPSANRRPSDKGSPTQSSPRSAPKEEPETCTSSRSSKFTSKTSETQYSPGGPLSEDETPTGTPSTKRSKNVSPTRSVSSYTEEYSTYKTSSTSQTSQTTPSKKRGQETVSARRNIFERGISSTSSTRPTSTPSTPTTPTTTGHVPSYMAQTLSSMEHRRDSLEVTKNNFQRKTSVDDEPYEGNPRSSVKFGVDLKHTEEIAPRRKSSCPEIPHIEDIFDLQLLEQMLETVNGYEQRRRIRAQIRIVKRLNETKKKEEKTTTTTYATTRTQSPYTKSEPMKTVQKDKPRMDSKRFIENESSHITKHEEKVVRERSVSPQSKVKTVTTVTEVRKIAGKPKISPAAAPTEDKPIWATKNILKKASETDRSARTTSVKKSTATTSRIQTQRQKVAVDEDCVTSSYGIGPTDEDGRPLFGIRALKKKTTTDQPSETTKVTGTVITEKFYSENGAQPVGERKVTVYSTNPEDLEELETKYDRCESDSIKCEKTTNDGLTSITKVQKIGKHDAPENLSVTDGNTQSKVTPKIGRRGSVKEMSEKFIRKESSSSVTEKTSSSSSSYPKAGLILRTKTHTSSRDETSPERSNVRSSSPGYDDESECDIEIRTSHKSSRVVTESESESESVQMRKTVKKSTRSFLNSTGSKVTGMDDVLDRMRNADNVMEAGDSVEDQEARALLNKFLGASVLMSGVESMVPPEAKRTNGTADNLRTQEVKTTRVTKTIKTAGNSSSPVITKTRAIEEIWDEETLKQLLAQSTNYEERRDIRARIKHLMAEREACAEIVASVTAELEQEKREEKKEKVIIKETKVEKVVKAKKEEVEEEEEGEEEEEEDCSSSEYEEIIEEVTDDSDEDVVKEEPKQAKSEAKQAEQVVSTVVTTTTTTVVTEEAAKAEEPKNIEAKEKREEKVEVKVEGEDEGDQAIEGESLLPLLQGLLHKNMPQARNQTNQTTANQGSQFYKSSGNSISNGTSGSSNSSNVTQSNGTMVGNRTVNNPTSSNLRNSQSFGQQREDSGTESGEDLRLIAAGLRDTIQMHSMGADQSNESLINDVTAALSRLESSLKEGRDINLDRAKRSALLALVARLQTGLISPDKISPSTPAPSGLPEDETSSPEADNHRSNRQRFAKRRNRANRHTVGVSREELADARRYMEDLVMMETLSSCTTPESNVVTPPEFFAIQKQNSAGAILGYDAQEQSALYRPNQFVPNSIKQSMDAPPPVQMREKKAQLVPAMRQSADMDKIAIPAAKPRPLSDSFPQQNRISFQEQRIYEKNLYNQTHHSDAETTAHPYDYNSDQNPNCISPDTVRTNRFNNKKQMMKRANTIDIPKPMKYLHDMDSDSEIEEKGLSSSKGIGLRGTVQVTVKRKPRNVVPPFQPKTENDHKFLAFIQKQSPSHGLGWNTANKAVTNWTNKFGNIKSAFESGAVASSSKPPVPPSSSAAKNFWKKTADEKVPPKAVDRTVKPPWADRNYSSDVLTGALQTKKRTDSSNAALTKPVPLNQFSHAPQSAFKPLEPAAPIHQAQFKPIQSDQPRPQSLKAPAPHKKALSSSPHYSLPSPTKSWPIVGKGSNPNSPIGVPWASKPKTENSVLKLAAARFENKSPDEHIVRHNSLKYQDRAYYQQGKYSELQQKRPSLPDTSQPYSYQRTPAAYQRAPQPLYDPRFNGHPHQGYHDVPMPHQSSPGYSQAPMQHDPRIGANQAYQQPPLIQTDPRISQEYHHQPQAYSAPQIPYTHTDYTPPTASSYIPAEYRQPAPFVRQDSLTNPQAEPLVLTNSNPSYSPHNLFRPQEPLKIFDFPSPSESMVTSSPNYTHTEVTDDDLDAESLLEEFKVEAKVMKGPVSQQAVTVGKRTNHVGDEEKDSRAAKSLLSVMTAIGKDRSPRSSKSPKVCISPDGRSYQAPIVEPLFPELAKFEPNREPTYVKEKLPEYTHSAYSQNPVYVPPNRQAQIGPQVIELQSHHLANEHPKPVYESRQVDYQQNFQAEESNRRVESERRYQEEQAKYEEAKRRAEIKRKREDEEAKYEEAKRRAEEQARYEEAKRRAELQRKSEEEAKYEEAKRRAEEQARYEEAKRRAELQRKREEEVKYEEAKRRAEIQRKREEEQAQYEEAKRRAEIQRKREGEAMYEEAKRRAELQRKREEDAKYDEAKRRAEIQRRLQEEQNMKEQQMQSRPQIAQKPNLVSSQANRRSNLGRTYAPSAENLSSYQHEQQQYFNQKKTTRSNSLENQKQAQNHAMPKGHPNPVYQESFKPPVGSSADNQVGNSAPQGSKQTTSKVISQSSSKSSTSTTISNQNHMCKQASLDSQNRIISQALRYEQSEQQTSEKQLRRKSLHSDRETITQTQAHTLRTQEKLEKIEKSTYKSSAPADTPDIVKSSLPKDENFPILKKFGPPQRHCYMPNSYQNPLTKSETSASIVSTAPRKNSEPSVQTKFNAPEIRETPSTPQPPSDEIPRNIVFNNVAQFSSMSSRQITSESSSYVQTGRPNPLSKCDSWHQICQQQNAAQPPSPKFGTPAGDNALRRTKSGHTLALPKMYEGRINKEEITEKQKTVAAYFSGQKSPGSLSRNSSQTNLTETTQYNEVAVKKSSINRIKSSQKASISHHNPSSGLSRSQTMPQIALLDETNVEDAFEKILSGS